MASGLPAKVRGRSLAKSIAGDAGETGRAICADVMCSASVPKTFDSCTRTAGPPTERWKICRTVASVRSSGDREFCGSGICCDAPQAATQFAGDDGCLDCATLTTPLKTVGIKTRKENFRAYFTREDLI